MAETLINLNQNQLNMENGSFIELIKSTQEGKEKLATALVNKGANVSSSSTLSDMATALGNIKSLDGIDVIKGNIGNVSFSSNVENRFNYGTVVQNEYGIFYFYVTSVTNLRVINVTPSLYSATGNFNYVDFTVNTLAGGSYLYNYKMPAYVSPDGTKFVYCTTDNKTIYEYTLNFSGVTGSTPVNITCNLTKTYTLSSALSDNAIVFVYDETNKRIGLCVGSTTSAVNRTFYFVTYTDEVITGLTATQFTKDGLGSGNCSSPVLIDNNRCIIAVAANSTQYYRLCSIDYVNSKIIGLSDINFGASFSWNSSSASNLFGQGPFIKIGTRTALAMAFVNVCSPAYRVIQSALVLVFTDDYSVVVSKQLSYNAYMYNLDSHYYYFNVIPSYANDGKVYIATGLPSAMWTIEIVNSEIIATAINSLFIGPTSSSLSYYARLAFYNITENKIIAFNSTYNFTAYDVLKNQVLGFRTNFGNGETLFLESDTWTNATSGKLAEPVADVLEEAE